MPLKRLAMVPGDSSAARIPLPGAAIAACIFEGEASRACSGKWGKLGACYILDLLGGPAGGNSAHWGRAGPLGQRPYFAKPLPADFAASTHALLPASILTAVAISSAAKGVAAILTECRVRLKSGFFQN